jgi:hypothetical protein
MKFMVLLYDLRHHCYRNMTVTAKDERDAVVIARRSVTSWPDAHEMWSVDFVQAI